jgi:hypothetical protein
MRSLLKAVSLAFVVLTAGCAGSGSGEVAGDQADVTAAPGK